MALPDAVEVQASHSPVIVAKEGLPQSKLKSKLVLKYFLWNVKFSKSMFFPKKKEEEKIENRSDADPAHPP